MRNPVSADDELTCLRRAIENAPRRGTVASGLRGAWTGVGWYVCAKCLGRILARGCRLPEPCENVWVDQPDPYGVCCLCERELVR